MDFPQQGGCQCGAVRYEITGSPVAVYACHCTECQRQSGSAFAMGAVIPQEHFRITRGDPKMYARQTSPTKTMECWFCADCGTRLYHVPGGASYANRNVKPGTLDDTSWLTPTIHFWAQRAQKWVRIPEGETRYETQPESLPWHVPKS
jgi:hypothetical protein